MAKIVAQQNDYNKLQKEYKLLKAGKSSSGNVSPVVVEKKENVPSYTSISK
eukprot:UN10511